MNRKILVVDDEKELLKAFKIQLEQNGYEVLTAGDGVEGLNVAEKENPDLVITDVIMPEKDGAEFIFDLQRRFPRIKLIVMSGGGDYSAQVYLKPVTLYSKVKYAFEKPIDMDEMLKAIKKLLYDE